MIGRDEAEAEFSIVAELGESKGEILELKLSKVDIGRSSVSPLPAELFRVWIGRRGGARIESESYAV